MLSPVHTINNVEATLSNAISRTILSTKSNVASTLLPFLATMLPNVERNFVLSTKSKQIEHAQFVLTFEKIALLLENEHLKLIIEPPDN